MPVIYWCCRLLTQPNRKIQITSVGKWGNFFFTVVCSYNPFLQTPNWRPSEPARLSWADHEGWTSRDLSRHPHSEWWVLVKERPSWVDSGQPANTSSDKLLLTDPNLAVFNISNISSAGLPVGLSVLTKFRTGLRVLGVTRRWPEAERKEVFERQKQQWHLVCLSSSLSHQSQEDREDWQLLGGLLPSGQNMLYLMRLPTCG